MKITPSATSATSTAYGRHARVRERPNPKQLAELAGALNGGLGIGKREDHKPRQTIDLHVDPTAAKHTTKGPCYNARLNAPDGEIVACSTEPLFAACRELVKRGITGQIRKYRDGMLCAEGDIEQLAGLTVYETKTRGPELRKYQEHPIVVSRKDQKTAETPSEVPRTRPQSQQPLAVRARHSRWSTQPERRPRMSAASTARQLLPNHDALIKYQGKSNEDTRRKKRRIGAAKRSH